jgi:hypothetical protein
MEKDVASRVGRGWVGRPESRRGTSSVELAPLALLARLAALVSPLRRQTFEIDTGCPRYKAPLRLIALIATEDTIKKFLSAMGLPTEPPRLLARQAQETRSSALRRLVQGRPDAVR